MKCPRCNYKQVPSTAQFCPSCGHRLGAEAAGAGSQFRVEQHVDKIEGSGKVVGVSIDQMIVVSSLSDLDTIDKATRRQLKDAYHAQIQRSPEQASYHLALGLHYLDLGMYADAITSLSTAHQRAPQDANALYYLALAHIGGKRPRILAWSDVRTIETYLSAAVRIGPQQAHYLYLWALLKYDYYLGNGLRVTPPPIEELLADAELATIEPAEVEHLLRHVPVPQSPLTEAIMGNW